MSSISFGPGNSGVQVAHHHGPIFYDSSSGQSKTQQHNDRHENIVNYFVKFDFSTRYRDAFAARHANTGQWFLDTCTFQEWLTNIGQTLWCSGMPGAGKTILVAIAIAHLQETFSAESDVAVVFAFCDYNDRINQEPESIIWSLWKQLMRKRILTAAECAFFETTYVEKRIFPSTDDLLKILSDEICRYSKVFILLDAFDELKVDSRDRLVDLLQRLPTRNNLLITSRYPKPEDFFSNNISQLEVRASNSDLESYINGRIESSQRLRSLVQRERKLREHIKNVITEKAAGMFLLAKFHVESVATKHTVRSVRDSLKDLPEGKNAVYKTYDSAMSRICDQIDEDHRLGMDIIMWISHAYEPLTLKDLQYVLTLQEGDTELNILDLIPGELFTSTCAGLVTIERESLKVRFVHTTTQEYIDNIKAIRFSDAQIRMTNSCIQFLSLEILCNELDVLKPQKFSDVISNYPFLEYAALNWGSHAGLAANHEEVRTELKKKIELFVHCTRQFRFSVRVLLARIAAGQGIEVGIILAKNQCVVHSVNIFAYFGLDFLLDDFMNDPGALLNSHDGFFGNVLHWATMGNHLSTMNLLLTHKNIPDIIDQGGHENEPPLDFAVEYRRDLSAALLLDHGADFLSYEDYKTTPLGNAVVKGNIGLVQKILSTESGKTTLLKKLYRGQTAIHEAARWRKDALILFLQAVDEQELGIDLVELTDDMGQNPLHWAAEAGHCDNSKILLQSKYGAGLATSRDSRGRTPVELAAFFGHAEVTELLINWIRETFSAAALIAIASALLAAAGNGQATVVDMLLNHHSQAVSDNMEVEVALYHASCSGSVETVRVILEWAHYENSQAARNRALFLAAERGHAELVRYLIQQGAAMHAVDEHGQTALHLASKKNMASVIRLLLNSTIDIDAEDSEGKTALHIAAEHRASNASRLLLTAGAQLSKIPRASESLTWLRSQIDDDEYQSGETEVDGSVRTSYHTHPAYIPQSHSDQLEVCFYLKEASNKRLSLSIISKILDLAEFWLRSYIERSERSAITESEAATFNYLRSAPIVGNHAHPVRRIDFSITSHDQGFSDDEATHGQYFGSYTWFDACREVDHGTNGTNERYRRDGMFGPQIFCNIHASSAWRTHRVSWSESKITKSRNVHTDDDLRGTIEETDDLVDWCWQPHMRPDPVKWLGELRPGDRVTVIPRAHFRGWTNFVLRAEMIIYTSYMRPVTYV